MSVKYKEISYAESTGTQYIDTGIKATPNTRVVIHFLYTTRRAQDAIFGTHRDNHLFYSVYVNSAYKFGRNYNDDTNNSRETSVQAQSITEYIVDMDGMEKTLKINNTTINLERRPVKNSFDNLLIMAYTNRTTGSPAGLSRMRVYSCKVYDDGVLVRDYIPVRDNNDVVCLYDKVSDDFFYSSGTEELVSEDPGEPVYEELIYDRTQADVDYVKNNPGSIELLKGTYNYNDLNRIERVSKYLAGQLNTYNYSVQLTAPKTDWIMEDFPIEVELERIRQNVQRLKDAFVTFTMVPANMEKVTYQKANDLERVLHELDVLINNMIQSFIFSNEVYSGEV